ncbi:MAG: o-succinylbenzoate synthase, partial [Cyanobium sp.]
MSVRLQLQWRPFSFPLFAPLQTAAGTLRERRGWLLRLDTAAGTTGWGEAAPLAFGGGAQEVLRPCGRAMEQLGGTLDRGEVEQQLPSLPPPLAFAIGAALAEADGLVGAAASGWRQAPPSAWLLPAGAGALGLARTLWEQGAPAPTFKWKVGVHATNQEQAWYGELAAGLPAGGKLRLDANGGLDRQTAWRWAELLGGDRRLEWLEQPLPPADHRGLQELSSLVPVALDESLRESPTLREAWPGWQVRRPSQEGDHRPLLRDLQRGRPRLMVSTSFETGIGRRWLAHLAALQAAGPT